MKAAQNYTSDYLTHFVGRGLENEEMRYQLLLKIIKEGIIKFLPEAPPNSFPIWGISPLAVKMEHLFNESITCFADIPLYDLSVHVNKYSKFGIAFNKSFLIGEGANPVHYVSLESAPPVKIENEEIETIEQYYVRNFKTAIEITRQLLESQNLDASTEKKVGETQEFLFYMFNQIKAFQPNLEDEDPENVYLEREWRKFGNVIFDKKNIVYVIVPQEFKERLLNDLSDIPHKIRSIEELSKF